MILRLFTMLIAMLCIAPRIARAESEPIALLPLDADGRLEIYGQPIAAEIARALTDGKLTVVEFFDYRCSFCKLAEPELAKLIKANPDVRFVFKEFVIFGAESEAAARAAIGARAQGKYYDLHQRFMAEKALTTASLPRLMQTSGVNTAAATKAGAQDAVTKQLNDAKILAQQLGVQGTPAFFVGDVMIPGADMEALSAAIAAAKSKRT